MLSFLPAPIIGFFSIILYFTNLFFWAILLCASALIRAVIPNKWWKKVWTNIIHSYQGLFNDGNNLIMRLFMKTQVVTPNFPELHMDKSYLLISNHQTWTDILILFKVFNHKIPAVKFFIKKQLIWLPLVGIAAWVMDFPFMSRHSKEQIQKNPALKGKDFESAMRACSKFKNTPTTIINFAEGTRFTPEKHNKQNSPFQHLLKPKAGGSALVLKALGKNVDKLIDVTIIYPDGLSSAWDFACGKIEKIVVYVNAISIAEVPQGDYENDPKFRSEFQQFLNTLWQKKDQFITDCHKTQQSQSFKQLNIASD